jgi:hypothetical protein
MAGGSPDLSQARARIHPTLAPAPGSRGQQVEHTCERRGALTYLAALDIGRRRGRAPRVFGRSETKGGIEPFDRLVWQVMTREPYASARRVFWIVDNGSAHRGQRSIDRSRVAGRTSSSSTCPPTRAGSIRSRSTSRSSSARCLTERVRVDHRGGTNPQRLRVSLERGGEPFEWDFTRDDLTGLMDSLAPQESGLRAPHDRQPGAQSERWETTLTSVPLGSRSMKRRTPHSSSRSE